MKQWIRVKQMAFLLFSWTHKCRHHHLCYNVTHSIHTDTQTFIRKKIRIASSSLSLSLSRFLFPLVVPRFLFCSCTLYADFSRSPSIFIDFNFFFDVFGRTKTENKLSGIITRFHLLTAHSIQFLVVSMEKDATAAIAEWKEKETG